MDIRINIIYILPYVIVIHKSYEYVTSWKIFDKGVSIFQPFAKIFSSALIFCFSEDKFLPTWMFLKFSCSSVECSVQSAIKIRFKFSIFCFNSRIWYIHATVQRTWIFIINNASYFKNKQFIFFKPKVFFMANFVSSCSICLFMLQIKLLVIFSIISIQWCERKYCQFKKKIFSIKILCYLLHINDLIIKCSMLLSIDPSCSIYARLKTAMNKLGIAKGSPNGYNESIIDSLEIVQTEACVEQTFDPVYQSVFQSESCWSDSESNLLLQFKEEGKTRITITKVLILHSRLYITETALSKLWSPHSCRLQWCSYRESIKKILHWNKTNSERNINKVAGFVNSKLKNAWKLCSDTYINILYFITTVESRKKELIVRRFQKLKMSLTHKLLRMHLEKF